MKTNKLNTIKTVSLIGLLFTTTIISSACGEVHQINGATFEYGFIRDISKSTGEYKSEVNANIILTILKEMGIEAKSATSNGASIYFSYIGSSYIPIIRNAKIDAKNTFITPQNKRLDEVSTFISNVNLGFNWLQELPSEDETTNLYLSMMNVISQLDHSADYRKLIVSSDLRESSSILSIENYMKDGRISDENYELLKSKLIESEPISKSYAGMEIVFIVPGESQEAFIASKFWNRFFSEADISVSTVSAY